MISLFWRLIMMNATSSYFLVSQTHFRRFAGLRCPPHVFLPVETWKWSTANGRWWNTDVVHTQEKLILKYYLQELLRTNYYYSLCTHTHKIETNSQSCRHEFNLKNLNKQTDFLFRPQFAHKRRRWLNRSEQRELACEWIWLGSVPHFWREHSVTVSSFI